MSKILAFTRKPSNVNQNERPSHDIGATSNLVERQAQEPEVESRATDGILISIVVPTCGRPQLLSRCLAALILQHFDSSRFEIIVVDDERNPKTCEVTNNWANHTACNGPAITYIPSQGRHGLAAARNLGWKAARGGIIAFTEDDAVARSDWLQRGLDAFHGDVQAARGRIVMPLKRKPTDYELDAKSLEHAEFTVANCFCRKSTLEKLGGFDERFRRAWREDADLYFRLLGIKARVAYVPSAVIVHPIRPAVWGVSLAQQRKVLFDALLFRKHPELYRKKIRAEPLWDYYLTVLALLAFLFGLVADISMIATVAGSIWIALTLRLSMMRLRHTVKTPAHIGEMLVTSALIPPLAVFWRLVGAFRFRVPPM